MNESHYLYNLLSFEQRTMLKDEGNVCVCVCETYEIKRGNVSIEIKSHYSCKTF